VRQNALETMFEVFRNLAGLSPNCTAFGDLERWIASIGAFLVGCSCRGLTVGSGSGSGSALMLQNEPDIIHAARLTQQDCYKSL